MPNEADLQKARELASNSSFPEEDPALGAALKSCLWMVNAARAAEQRLHRQPGCRAEATQAAGLQSRGYTGRRPPAD